MDQPHAEALVIGCHHKTGTNLLLRLAQTITEKFWRPKEFYWGKSDERKLPLSQVLSRKQGAQFCYVNLWFEHEVDVPACSVRFLHFIRHPAKWVRSAYLYHKAGGHSERVPWLKWRIFRTADQYLSYHELMNRLPDKVGLMVEAIRSYPEIAGAARAASTSAHLRARHQVTLEQFRSDFGSNVRAVARFIGMGEDKLDEVVEALGQHDLSRRRVNELPANVTGHLPASDDLERYLMADPGFHRLYAQPGLAMGFSLEDAQPRSTTLLDEALIGRVLDARNHLLCHPDTEQAQAWLQNDATGPYWLHYVLQQFGEGGHLMMHPFIQSVIDARP